ncbi:monosaccharide ABC transporter substrate-binding protein, CUT2 family (TC 3.A.1.2.-) [Streptococcus gallolyticus]|uniref:Monosaccharide ABC transporter substrate-binding protein, CUT2 family (TC 3.A.1.2.-) n=1 Tax=Streptococcus gallolyticus TaxID=315405 RepID=A0A1H7VZQ4_9STRE|nr:sugar ABC transporter substrate-binding protein [Streptococcus gallolyticus]SEF22993.1 ribose transport system substrate-binding protein [Streptococcus gallolyticus]SEM14349.1 monosaccharide ABC transporter substrate-binding protein, CUT2 family (TC 3.A.1.2.-) [Streptococcus gallolyticus]
MKKGKLIALIISVFIALLTMLGIYLHYKLVPYNENRVKIGATYMTMNNDFYKVLNNEIDKIVEENNDILYTRDPALDVNKQTQQVELFIKKGVNIIIINPVDANSKKLIKVLKKAKKTGIKIVVVDSQLSDNSPVDTTIVSDNYQAGVLCAQNLMQTQSSAKILLLEHQKAVSAVDRINGFLATIKGHDSYQVVDRKDCLGQTEVAMPQVESVINSGVDFDTVMALNDQVAIGALAAIENMKVTAPVKIYGVDGSPDMKNLLATTSSIQATVAQSPLTIGEKAIQAGYRLYQDKKVDKEIVIPVEFMTSDNVLNSDLTGWQ